MKKSKDHYYLVMEYINGGGLSNCLKKYMENSLETKTNEYNILMDKRDEDLSLLKNEFISLEKEMKELENFFK